MGLRFAENTPAGRLSDRFGRRPTYFIGAVTASTGLLRLLHDGQRPHTLIPSGSVVGLVFHGLMHAAQGAAMAGMFPTRMPYSGVSFGYQVTAIAAGSPAPIIAVRLLETYKSGHRRRRSPSFGHFGGSGADRPRRRHRLTAR